MLKLIFNCDVFGGRDQRRLRRLHRSIGSKCSARKIGGFMAQTSTGFYGCFEGDDRDVIGMVEILIRQPEIAGVSVVSENHIRDMDWSGWQEDVCTREDLERVTRDLPGELAELAAFPVDASQSGVMRPEV